MATSPRLKYPFVAGMGTTVYLVTANVTAAKIAAAASSRVLTISTSLVCGFAPKQKDAQTRASWGHSGADPPQPSPHTDYTVDPGIPPGHGPGTPVPSHQGAVDLPTAYWLLPTVVQGPHGLSPPIGNRA